MEKNRRERKFFFGDSMLNGVNEKGLSKSHNVKVKNYPSAASETSLKRFIKSETRLLNVGTNGLTNNVNLLNSVKK